MSSYGGWLSSPPFSGMIEQMYQLRLHAYHARSKSKVDDLFVGKRRVQNRLRVRTDYYMLSAIGDCRLQTLLKVVCGGLFKSVVRCPDPESRTETSHEGITCKQLKSLLLLAMIANPKVRPHLGNLRPVLVSEALTLQLGRGDPSPTDRCRSMQN